MRWHHMQQSRGVLSWRVHMRADMEGQRLFHCTRYAADAACTTTEQDMSHSSACCFIFGERHAFLLSEVLGFCVALLLLFWPIGGFRVLCHAFVIILAYIFMIYKYITRQHMHDNQGPKMHAHLPLALVVKKLHLTGQWF
jgi:hypothetical protein